MSAAVPLREDFRADDLRRLARESRDADQSRRPLALAAIYDCASRTEAARIGAVGLQTVRGWTLVLWRPQEAPGPTKLSGRVPRAVRLAGSAG